MLGSLTRHGSLRLPKASSQRLTSGELSGVSVKAGGGGGGVLVKLTAAKKVAPAEPADHHLTTVAENAGAEETEGVVAVSDKDRSPSLLKRIGIVKGKDKSSPSSSSSSSVTKKTVLVSSAHARAGQDKKK